MKHYDYIIAGAGCAGLSLLTRMILSKKFKDKKILLVDKSLKQDNDRTWCYWETSSGFFEPLVYKKWDKLYFHSKNHSKLLNIEPFAYKMIRSIDFYQYCFDLIKNENIDIETDVINSLSNVQNRAIVTLSEKKVSADYIFSSILPDGWKKQPNKHYLWQHFSGWFIKTAQPCFDESIATLMDFRVKQHNPANFIYLLPIANNRAMVEYTAFSKNVLKEEYEGFLKEYISERFPGVVYEIEAREEGSIPMTNHKFSPKNGRIIYLGTAGGFTKPSSGYTFQFIQSHSQKLLGQLLKGKAPYGENNWPDRFMWYDSIMLRVLSDGLIPAEEVFEKLFCNNSPRHILNFLNNATAIGDDLSVINSLPKLPFMLAAIKELNPIKN